MSFNAPAPVLEVIEPEAIEPDEERVRPVSLPRAYVPTQARTHVDQRSWHLHLHVHEGPVAQPMPGDRAAPTPNPAGRRAVRRNTVALFTMAALLSACLAVPVLTSPLVALPAIAFLLNAAIAIRVATANQP